jgi:hypothetical protein
VKSMPRQKACFIRAANKTRFIRRGTCATTRVRQGPCLAGPRIPPPGAGGTGADLDRLLRCLVLPCNRYDSTIPVFPHGASMTRQPHSRVTGGSLTQRPRPTAPRLLGPSCIGAAELELPYPHKGETRKFFSFLFLFPHSTQHRTTQHTAAIGMRVELVERRALPCAGRRARVAGLRRPARTPHA